MNEELKKEENNKDDGDAGKVNILVDASQDMFEATITLIPASESSKIDINEIRNTLSEKGVIYGIIEDVLSNLENEPKFNEKLLIASGLRPTDGIDGSIKYNFNLNESFKIKKGEIIGEILPPEEGTEGFTVYEDKTPPKKAVEAQIPILTNAALSPDNKNLIISTIEGYIKIEPIVIDVRPFFELKTDPDKMKAYIKVVEPQNENDFSSDDLKQLLNDNKIIYGIKEDKIKNIFVDNKFEQEILIAQGKEVIHGKNGEIKFTFDTEIKPKMDEKGNVNYKDLNLIQNFKKGDKLAEAIPPVEGTAGSNIFGEEIKPKEGTQAFLPIGNNSYPDPENPNILLSAIDGSINMKGNKVNIDPVFIVKENVDYETGNIDFIGSVIVKGDVKSGFNIKAQGDLQIDGVVEDATIEVEGDVLIKSGFVGKGDGKIVAGGNVMAQFCESENIVCAGDIIVSDYVMHCNIDTKGKLIVTNQNGLIVGGSIYAVKGVEAKIIGNPGATATKIFAGIDKETKDKIEENKVRLSKNIENEKKIRETLEFLDKEKRRRKKLTEDKEVLLQKIIQLKESNKEERERISSELEEFEAKMEEFKNSIIKIDEAVYPGTIVTIYNKNIEVEESVYFKYSDKGIKAEDLEDLEKKPEE
ncbi:flagellar assembly protein A [candidate division KSB1 bacterium]